MIEIEGLSVRFGAVCALDALDARLTEPVCGLIGPNGAGKTTLVNLLSGLVQAESGQVRIDGSLLLPMTPR
ncbi:MAG: ATP-binding cassette domain-containing protein, partial [Microbacteriaceae bacterium]|nr:ATP-binding cassette domain-containing protein [Burkholderiaceae bacterium]